MGSAGKRGKLTERPFMRLRAGPFEPAMLWRWNGTCQPDVVGSSTDYYALTEVAPSMLAELTDIKE